LEKKAFGEFKCQIFVIEVRITESWKRGVAQSELSIYSLWALQARE